jgi:hypothetical protein
MSNIYRNSAIDRPKPNSNYIKEYYAELTDTREHPDTLSQEERSYENKFLSANTLSPDEFLEKFGDTGVETIYEWYHNAMIRRNGADGEPRVPLEYNRFYSHFFESQSTDNTLLYGNTGDGFLLGSTFDNFFHISHFAPKTLKGGYRLLKNLGEDRDISALLNITADLIQTIKKIKTWRYSETPLPGLGKYGEDKYLAWNNPYMVQSRLDNIVEYCQANGIDLPAPLVKSFLQNIFEQR